MWEWTIKFLFLHLKALYGKPVSWKLHVLNETANSLWEMVINIIEKYFLKETFDILGNMLICLRVKWEDQPLSYLCGIYEIGGNS